ncbi:MAG: hypothetical protein ACLFTH_00390 [Candidatus Woesearchaeota archaeon]
MDPYTYALTVLLAFFGIFLGGILSYWSKDEVHEMKSKIPHFQMMIFVLVFVALFIYLPFFVAVALLVLCFGFIYIFWHKTDLNVLDYIVLGAVFVISSLVAEAHYYITATITFFGILSGALFYAMHTKPTGNIKWKKDEELHVKHHKHSGKHLHIDELLNSLFYKYYFFPILAIGSYIIAEIIAAIL